MDPVTHGLVGAAVAVISGAEVSITNPLLIATTLGAVAPDLDIVYQSRGHYTYLKNHRGLSHSIPGLAFLASLIGITLSFVFPEANFWGLILGAFLGALSHTLLDLMNSYGVMLFYPFSRKKYTFNLLMITDPFLIGTSLAIIYFGAINSMGQYYFAGVFSLYLLGRLLMRRRAQALIKKYYYQYSEVIVVMPAFIGLFQWDFIVRKNNKNIVGQINLITNKIKIHKRLRLISEEIKETLEDTKIGEFFKEFTPFWHIDYRIVDDKIVGVFTDMRYFVKNKFLHHATVIVDKESRQVEQGLFQPYNQKNKIEITYYIYVKINL